MYIYIVCTYMHVYICPFLLTLIAPDAHGPSCCAHTNRLDDEYQQRQNTGLPRLIGCLKLQVIFRKRATSNRALLRKMTNKDKASYGSWPPCISTVSRLALLMLIIIALMMKISKAYGCVHIYGNGEGGAKQGYSLPSLLALACPCPYIYTHTYLFIHMHTYTCIYIHILRKHLKAASHTSYRVAKMHRMP